MSTSTGCLTPEEIRTAVRAACRAPSLHNTQPWRFEIGPDDITIRLDHERLLPGTDPDGREARISCGAAAFNLRVALTELGFTARTHLTTRPADGAIARIEVLGRRTALEQDHQLHRALWRRSTNRRPFSDRPIPLDALHDMRAAAAAESAMLTVIAAPVLHRRIRELSNHAVQEQIASPLWTAEWQAWTGRENMPDGVPGSAAGPPPDPLDLWNLKDFGPPGRPGPVPGKGYEHEPVIAVVSSSDDHPRSQVQAGLALEHVLLTATSHGLAASFLSQTIEVPTARARLRTLLGGSSEPQVVLRIGYGTPVPTTPRRPIDECLIDSRATAAPGLG